MISPESPSYLGGYILSGVNYEKPFYMYLPAFLGVYQFSRFITLRHMAILAGLNVIIGDILGQYLVNKRVSEY